MLSLNTITLSPLRCGQQGRAGRGSQRAGDDETAPAARAREPALPCVAGALTGHPQPRGARLRAAPLPHPHRCSCDCTRNWQAWSLVGFMT